MIRKPLRAAVCTEIMDRFIPGGGQPVYLLNLSIIAPILGTVPSFLNKFVNGGIMMDKQ